MCTDEKACNEADSKQSFAAVLKMDAEIARTVELLKSFFNEKKLTPFQVGVLRSLLDQVMTVTGVPSVDGDVADWCVYTEQRLSVTRDDEPQLVVVPLLSVEPGREPPTTKAVKAIIATRVLSRARRGEDVPPDELAFARLSSLEGMREARP